MADDILLVGAGTILVLAVFYDLLATTISLSAVRGPLSSRLSALMWRVGNRRGPRLRAIQRLTGPLLVISILIGCGSPR